MRERQYDIDHGAVLQLTVHAVGNAGVRRRRPPHPRACADRDGGGPPTQYHDVLMATHTIRLFGDPVLKRPTGPVTDIDGALVRLVDAMYETMYEAPGVGLAAPQVGVQKRFFVYDVNDDSGPHVVFNPEIIETSGEWLYEEGCLSLPGLAFPIVRPKLVTVRGVDVDGNDVTIEGDELLGRVFLHEIDHLDGVLMLERLDRDERKRAMRELREQGMGVPTPGGRRHAL
jgi:peptide deformylase